jgi:hypothetical protein
MGRLRTVAGIGLLAAVIVSGGPLPVGASPMAQTAQSGGSLDPAYLDKLLAPVALYPDQLLAQVLLCSGNSRKVGELSAWLKQATLKGSELQKAAEQAGFEPSFVALAPFPQVVDLMAGNLTWTSQLGGAFAVDRSAVFDSIQRLRKQAQEAGNLKTTEQQEVETKKTSSGQDVIVIEPSNPQVIYVPTYNPSVVYVEDDDDGEAAAAALIGFTAGIALGAAIDNDYYYGPWGFHGGAYMYNDAWDDYYDHREDAREDWMDHREDVIEDRGERRQDANEQRTERTESRQENRTDRAENRPETAAAAQGQRSGERAQQAQAQRSETQTQRTQSAKGHGSTSSQSTASRSGGKSDALSGYGSGKSTRAASSRGQASRGASRGGGGGGGRRR